MPEDGGLPGKAHRLAAGGYGLRIAVTAMGGALSSMFTDAAQAQHRQLDEVCK